MWFGLIINFTQEYNSSCRTLLKNRLLTLVIKDFQYRLLTDVETTDVKSINVNIGFRKPMLN